MKKHIILSIISFTIAHFSSIFAMEMTHEDIKESIQTRIATGENLNESGAIGIIPLIFAARHNDFTLFFKLLELQVDINIQDAAGLTPLSWAILEGNKGFAHLLINHGARGDIQDKEGDTAFSLAYEYYYVDIVRHLMADENKASLLPSQEKSEKQKESEKVTKKNTLAHTARIGMNIAKVGIKEGFKAAQHPIRYIKRAVNHPKKVMIETQRRMLDAIIKKELQEKFKDEKPKIDKKWSPLMMAVFNNDFETFVVLINDPKIDVNAREVAGYTLLSRAVDYGHSEIVNTLINHKDIVLDLPILGRVTPLMIAISSKHFDIVKLLLEKGANINATTKDGATPLITAIRYSTPEIVNLLLNDEALDVNIQDKWGKNALFYVIEGHNSWEAQNDAKMINFNIVKNLVEHGADLHIKDYRNYGLLFYAAKKGSLAITEYLVGQGVVIEDETITTSPLNQNHRVIDYRIIDFLQKRLQEINDQHVQEEMSGLGYSDDENDHKNDAELEISDEEILEKENDDVFTIEGKPNKQLGTLGSISEVDAELILEEQNLISIENQHEINIHLKEFVIALINGHFNTAYSVLCKENIDLEKVIKFLLFKNNSLDICYKDGSTLLMHAITFKNFEFVKLLLDYGANPNACNNDQITPLMYATNFDCLEIIDYLISEGALVNACDRFNKTPLVYAVEALNEHVAKLLVTKGADINDVSCVATFMIAARTEDLQTLKFLLDLRINPNISNKGGTALINAIKAKSMTVMKLLLEHGSDVNIDDGKKLPLQYAMIDFNPNIVKLLIEQGADLNVPYENETGLRMTILEYLNRAKKEPISFEGKKYFVKELNNRNIVFTDKKPWTFSDFFKMEIPSTFNNIRTNSFFNVNEENDDLSFGINHINDSLFTNKKPEILKVDSDQNFFFEPIKLIDPKKDYTKKNVNMSKETHDIGKTIRELEKLRAKFKRQREKDDFEKTKD